MTNVPKPALAANGFSFPQEYAVLAGVVADIQAAFGGTLNLSASNTATLSTPQGQLASSWAACITDCYAQFASIVAQVDPQYAQGLMQDGIGNIYFMTRYSASGTQVPGTVIGLAGTVIPTGVAVATDANGNQYSCATPSGGAAIIATNGTLVVFTNVATGPVAFSGPMSISLTTPGWDAITTTAPVILGSNTETQQQFELRRQSSVAINSVGITAAIRAAILSLTPISIPGSVYVVDNPSNAPMTVGGITLPPNSVYICSYNYPAYAAWTAVTTTVNGMPATSWQISSVSQAIFSKKSLGCSYAPSCILVGSVSGTTLTVSNVSSGTLVAGQTLLNSLTGQPYTNNGANVTITGGSGTSWTLNLTPGTLTGATLWTGTTNAVVDPSYPSLPQPSYSITFTTPVQIPVNVQVTLAAASNPPSSALSLLQASTGVIAAFTGADGLLPASQIGATTYSSRFYSTVAGLLPASTVIGIQIGATAAAFNGTLSGNALTVNSLTSGALAVGQTLYWTGCQGSSGTGPLPTIVSGSGTSWVISTASLTASAVAMTATVMGNSQPININQISTMGSVYLVLQ